MGFTDVELLEFIGKVLESGSYRERALKVCIGILASLTAHFLNSVSMQGTRALKLNKEPTPGDKASTGICKQYNSSSYGLGKFTQIEANQSTDTSQNT